MIYLLNKFKKDIRQLINRDKLHKHWMKKFDELTEIQELVNQLKFHPEIKQDVKTWEKKLHGAVILLSFDWKDKELLNKKLDTFDFQSLKNELISKWGKWIPEELEKERSKKLNKIGI